MLNLYPADITISSIYQYNVLINAAYAYDKCLHHIKLVIDRITEANHYSNYSTRP